MPAKKPPEVDDAGVSPEITKAEEKKVAERVAIGAHIVHETIRREGEDELKRPSGALAWSGLAAGLSMGFSLVAEGLLAARLPDAPWRPLISKFGYSVGFLIVTLGRQQLFTETTLTAIIPLLARRNIETGYKVLRLWGAILLPNLIGTYLFAFCVAKVAIFNPQIQETMIAMSKEGLDSSFWVVFVRAVFAGWLIALMVWLLPGAESARVSIIIIITYLIGLGGFNHVIAGSNKMFFLLINGVESWGTFFKAFFLPSLIGNTVGGVALVAFLGHAQVMAGRENK